LKRLNDASREGKEEGSLALKEEGGGKKGKMLLVDEM